MKIQKTIVQLSIVNLYLEKKKKKEKWQFRFIGKKMTRRNCIEKSETSICFCSLSDRTVQKAKRKKGKTAELGRAGPKN